MLAITAIGRLAAPRQPAEALLPGEGRATVGEIQPVEANKPGEQRSEAPTPVAPSSGPIRRSGGHPGDLLVCTGPHGLSRLGLALLQGEIGAGTLDFSEASERAADLYALIAEANARILGRDEAGGADQADIDALFD